jgi:hypothetical protein
MTRHQRGGLSSMRQRPLLHPVRGAQAEAAKRSVFGWISKPKASDALRSAGPLCSRPEIDAGVVEETRGIEAPVQVDVRVQQNRQGCAQFVARTWIAKWTSLGASIPGIPRLLEKDSQSRLRVLTAEGGPRCQAAVCIFCSKGPWATSRRRWLRNRALSPSCRHYPYLPRHSVIAAPQTDAITPRSTTMQVVRPFAPWPRSIPQHRLPPSIVDVDRCRRQLAVPRGALVMIPSLSYWESASTGRLAN